MVDNREKGPKILVGAITPRSLAERWNTERPLERSEVDAKY
jgi:hypothetical protein